MQGLGLCETALGAKKMKDPLTIDINSPEIQALIQAKIDEQVSGLKSKNDELIGKLNKTKGEFDVLQSQLSDVDLEQFRGFKAKLQADETTKLIAEGKIDEVLNQRLQAFKQDSDAKLTQATQQAELYKSKVLSGYIASASASAGIDPSFIEIMPVLASQAGIQLDNHGNPVVVDQDGNVRYSKDGTTPLSIGDWIASLRETKPLFWGQPQGSGGSGSGGAKSNKKIEEYTEEDRIALYNKDPIAFNQHFGKKG